MNSKAPAQVFSDGGSRGNPGIGAAACILNFSHNTVKLARVIPECTNNQAEYTGVVLGLEYLFAQQYIGLEADWYLDSELVVKQLTGEYRLKNQELTKYVSYITKLTQHMQLTLHFHHIPRSQNVAADKLLNQIADIYV